MLCGRSAGSDGHRGHSNAYPLTTVQIIITLIKILKLRCEEACTVSKFKGTVSRDYLNIFCHDNKTSTFCKGSDSFLNIFFELIKVLKLNVNVYASSSK